MPASPAPGRRWPIRQTRPPPRLQLASSASESVADSEIERVRPIAVLRDDPADAIALIVFEDDDLLALRASKRSGKRQVRSIRETPAENEPSGRREREQII